MVRLYFWTFRRLRSNRISQCRIGRHCSGGVTLHEAYLSLCSSQIEFLSRFYVSTCVPRFILAKRKFNLPESLISHIRCTVISSVFNAMKEGLLG